MGDEKLREEQQDIMEKIQQKHGAQNDVEMREV